jgi:hypothetical protein
MAKAKYHKAQRVFVKPVGTWAYVEAVVPNGSKAATSPSRSPNDCGMGRDFAQEELEEEFKASSSVRATAPARLRVLRSQNRWKSAEQRGHHPYPGTLSTVVTSERDWSGWRVPGSEYDLDPHRIEHQAQMIAHAPVFVKLLEDFVQYADSGAEDLSGDLTKLAEVVRRVLDEVSE